MTLPFLKSLKAGPPPPKVVFLPDAVFFTRAIPVSPDSSPAAVAEQVELALETLSPFPAAQLYHGYFWPPGSDRALVFAAYRRRFSTEQTEEWEHSELVVPSFAALLGGAEPLKRTLIVPSAEGLTAVYWDGGTVPARVVFRALEPSADDAERQRAVDELTAIAPQNRTIILSSAPVVDESSSDREYVFRTDDLKSRVALAQAGVLDVRDKAALAALRRARTRDLALWRSFVGFAALLLLLGLGELGLIGLSFWQKTRVAQANAQRPVVEKITAAQSLTTRINELSTRRLLPFEMMDIVVPARPPNTIQFLRTSTSGLFGLNIEAQTTSPAAVSAYQSALSALPAVQRVEVRDQRTRDNVMSFTLLVTFKPEVLRPTATP
jgi:hypothetical protein